MGVYLDRQGVLQHPTRTFMMRTFSVAAFVLGTIGLSWASPASTARKVVHEKRAFDPAGWSRSRKLTSDVILPMRFGYVVSFTVTHNDLTLFLA